MTTRLYPLPRFLIKPVAAGEDMAASVQIRKGSGDISAGGLPITMDRAQAEDAIKRLVTFRGK